MKFIKRLKLWYWWEKEKTFKNASIKSVAYKALQSGDCENLKRLCSIADKINAEPHLFLIIAFNCLRQHPSYQHDSNALKITKCIVENCPSVLYTLSHYYGLDDYIPNITNFQVYTYLNAKVKEWEQKETY